MRCAQAASLGPQRLDYGGIAGDTSAFLKSIGTARVGGAARAVVRLKVQDYFPREKMAVAGPHEKNGKVNETGHHHKLEEYLDTYIGGGIGHANIKTTQAYDRREDEVSFSEIEQMGI